MTTILHSPKNYLPKIEEVYCFVSVDEGGEGVISDTIQLNGQTMIMPFVCADKNRMESLKPLAKEISKMSGKKIKLIKLTCREEIEDIS